MGKSTLCSNLAIALAQREQQVGLLDADIYGPSQPRMMGALSQKPEISATNQIKPLSRHGIKLMSMGLLVEEDQAVVWRGPMLFKAMDQLFYQVDWGELDYLLVDLPPGTGDVPLSMVQKVPVNGVISICTPQNVALADVKKSIDMFERLQIPMLGVVENMAYLFDPKNPEERQRIFPQGDLRSFLDSRQIKHLGEIPICLDISMACEMGIPYKAQKSGDPLSEAYEKIAQSILE